MAKNDNLHKAKDAKNDEFYTRIEDVAEELRHYKKHFAGKVVFCNCDDPPWFRDVESRYKGNREPLLPESLPS